MKRRPGWLKRLREHLATSLDSADQSWLPQMRDYPTARRTPAGVPEQGRSLHGWSRPRLP
jgi:hypothetical protein